MRNIRGEVNIWIFWAFYLPFPTEERLRRRVPRNPAISLSSFRIFGIINNEQNGMEIKDEKGWMEKSAICTNNTCFIDDFSKFWHDWRE
jgi:hypothetical protein